MCSNKVARRENRTHGLVCEVNADSKKSAFTLIELLVVIAIISLLVSILLPSLQKAKELARLTVCATNVHSIGLAMAMYASESDGMFPCGSYNWSSHIFQGTSPLQRLNLAHYYPEYIDNSGVFFCPGDCNTGLRGDTMSQTRDQFSARYTAGTDAGASVGAAVSASGDAESYYIPTSYYLRSSAGPFPDGVGLIDDSLQQQYRSLDEWGNKAVIADMFNVSNLGSYTDQHADRWNVGSADGRVTSFYCEDIKANSGQEGEWAQFVDNLWCWGDMPWYKIDLEW